MRNNGMIVTGLIIVGALILAGLAFMMPGTGMTYGGGMMSGTWLNGMGGTGANGMMGGWAVFGALVIGGTILALFYFVRRPGPDLVASAGRQSPLDALKMRYARGEITKEQFEQVQLSLKP